MNNCPDSRRSGNWRVFLLISEAANCSLGSLPPPDQLEISCAIHCAGSDLLVFEIAIYRRMKLMTEPREMFATPYCFSGIFLNRYRLLLYQAVPKKKNSSRKIRFCDFPPWCWRLTANSNTLQGHFEKSACKEKKLCFPNFPMDFLLQDWHFEQEIKLLERAL